MPGCLSYVVTAFWASETRSNMTSKSHSAPRLLSMAQVGDLTNVSTKTVSRWIAAKELRHHKLGRQVRVSEEDFWHFIASRRR